MSNEVLPGTLTLDALRALYIGRPSAVNDVVEEMLVRAASAQDAAIFISLVAPDDLRRASSDLQEHAAAGRYNTHGRNTGSTSWPHNIAKTWAGARSRIL